MKVIGLTGGIGSGKSYVSSLFEQLGISVVDADIAARQVVEPGQPALKQIVERYTSHTDILTAKGALNRPVLREIIFSHPDEKVWLEGLLHPLIRKVIVHQLTSISSPYAILSSPLLIETNQKDLCDQIIVVDLSEQQQIQRACQRDNVSEELIKKIIKSQATRASRIEAADVIIDNQESKDHTKTQVFAIHTAILNSL